MKKLNDTMEEQKLFVEWWIVDKIIIKMALETSEQIEERVNLASQLGWNRMSVAVKK